VSRIRQPDSRHSRKHAVGRFPTRAARRCHPSSATVTKKACKASSSAMPVCGPSTGHHGVAGFRSRRQCSESRATASSQRIHAPRLESYRANSLRGARPDARSRTYRRSRMISGARGMSGWGRGQRIVWLGRLFRNADRWLRFAIPLDPRQFVFAEFPETG